ncbi:hypothetical protein NLG97_g2175 [Lecanicillium saksenae]|uniref:Uncharacterized protein n=1 Tax=Lecanicillium saksenae TaxID=468837 RepID=A0ACC1R3I1_9HYPO|nr:hypothetical protein NLG97_g2175 [Lecanicillium saksenae]
MNSSNISSIIKRPLPNAVTYDLTSRDCVTITLPPQSTWTSGLHWHQDHEEYLKVVQGSIHVVLGDEEFIVSATAAHQPEIKVPRYAWHSWRRAEADGDEVIVVERTDPVDLKKAVFFWNLNGVILDAPALDARLSMLPSRLRALVMDFWITLSLFVIFHHLDNFPVFVNVPALLDRFLPSLKTWHAASRAGKWLDWAVTRASLWLAACLGRILGVTPVQRRYTPASIYERWRNQDKLA